MGPRGRGGNFRGRGSGGRGRGRGGRGRGGRGRGSSRYGPTRRFDGSRLADVDDEEESGSADSLGEADDLQDDVVSDDEDDDEEKPPARPYIALLQSFNEDNAPNPKRRKVDHQTPADSEGVAGEVGGEVEGNDNSDVDHVEEPEDALIGLEEEDEDENESDAEDGSTDPFDLHFAHPDEEVASQRVNEIKQGQWKTKRAMLQSLRAVVTTPGETSDYYFPKQVSGLDTLHIKQKLKETAGRKLRFGNTQRSISSVLFDYQDILYCGRTVQNSDQLRQIVCLHTLNHIFKTRDRVIKDNYRLAKDGNDAELELRDQGFTRPKALFLLPTRNSCLRMVNTISDLCDPDQQENRKRFEESYTDKEAKFDADRPADFRDLFDGNDDDMFRLGMKFTRKTIKYFSQFYNSDILFASPLGLRMAIGSEQEKKMDFDFLSSIEIVVMDQADALLMQNWEHVEYIFEYLNLQPKDAHGCDFSRVRNWYLEDWAKYYRQTIILSAFNAPELAELQRTSCYNWAGKLRLQPEYPGVLQQLGVKAKQTFSRFQAPSVDKDPDARFEYFTSAIVPSLVKRAKDAAGTLIFVPSYLDFVRVRNYFATSPAVSSIPFGSISEYVDVSDASRARSHFLTGRHRVLLYTERAHHFRRYQFRGVQRVILYGLPDNPIFYKEIAGGYLSKSEQDLKIEPGQGSVRVMFSKYDVMKLERIVGSKRVGKMISERGDTFDFV